MPFLLLIALVLVFTVLVEAGVIPSPGARVHLVVRNGRTEIVRGVLGSRARELVFDVLREHNVVSGFITVSGSSKLRFSGGIPQHIRQQLRNVILM